MSAFAVIPVVLVPVTADTDEDDAAVNPGTDDGSSEGDTTDNHQMQINDRSMKPLFCKNPQNPDGFLVGKFLCVL